VIEHENEYSAPIFIDTSILNSKVVLMLLTNSFLFKHAQTFCHHNPFIFLHDWILEELRPYHEAWAGIPLKGAMAYGLCVHRNGSNLHMHVDQSNTHIISFILHADHDDDPESESWPIIIEDFQGYTNDVFLENGDMFFMRAQNVFMVT
jgi:hypothetical protein